MKMHFNLNLLPPVIRVFATTVQAGSDYSILQEMLFWAVPGALLQIIGGSKKRWESSALQVCRFETQFMASV